MTGQFWSPIYIYFWTCISYHCFDVSAQLVHWFSVRIPFKKHICFWWLALSEVRVNNNMVYKPQVSYWWKIKTMYWPHTYINTAECTFWSGNDGENHDLGHILMVYSSNTLLQFGFNTLHLRGILLCEWSEWVSHHKGQSEKRHDFTWNVTPWRVSGSCESCHSWPSHLLHGLEQVWHINILMQERWNMQISWQ